MAPKQSTHPLARSILGAGPSRSTRNRSVPASRHDEAVVIEDWSMRRKRTSAARSSLLLPSDLTDSESPSKRHRASQSTTQMLTISDVDTIPPTPGFDATPADFDQFSLPPELDGIVVDHQVPPERSRKVDNRSIVIFVFGY